jgi:hypothetical protein
VIFDDNAFKIAACQSRLHRLWQCFKRKYAPLDYVYIQLTGAQ